MKRQAVLGKARGGFACNMLIDPNAPLRQEVEMGSHICCAPMMRPSPDLSTRQSHSLLLCQSLEGSASINLSYQVALTS